MHPSTLSGPVRYLPNYKFTPADPSYIDHFKIFRCPSTHPSTLTQVSAWLQVYARWFVQHWPFQNLYRRPTFAHPSTSTVICLITSWHWPIHLMSATSKSFGVALRIHSLQPTSTPFQIYAGQSIQRWPFQNFSESDVCASIHLDSRPPHYKFAPAEPSDIGRLKVSRRSSRRRLSNDQQSRPSFRKRGAVTATPYISPLN